MQKTIHIDGMSCGHCTAAVEKALGSISGVTDAKVDLVDKRAVVRLSIHVDDEVLADVIKNAGFTVVGIQ
jgi:Cu2+-exporting ATPase/Cu+-exporting ATPase